MELKITDEYLAQFTYAEREKIMLDIMYRQSSAKKRQLSYVDIYEMHRFHGDSHEVSLAAAEKFKDVKHDYVAEEDDK